VRKVARKRDRAARKGGNGVFQPLENFFPIIGKTTKNFSNHWKKWADFSNHWKNIFQSLENPGFCGGPADCAESGVV
jgi:hypothetical protein